MADAWTLIANASTVSSGDAWTRLVNLGSGEGTVLVEGLMSDLAYEEPGIELMLDAHVVEILSEDMAESVLAEVELEEREILIESLQETGTQLEW